MSEMRNLRFWDVVNDVEHYVSRCEINDAYDRLVGRYGEDVFHMEGMDTIKADFMSGDHSVTLDAAKKGDGVEVKYRLTRQVNIRKRRER